MSKYQYDNMMLKLEWESTFAALVMVADLHIARSCKNN